MNSKQWIAVCILLLIPISNALAQQPGAWTLQRAIGTYMEKNLDLQAARLRIEHAKADEIAARVRPNPGVTVAAENLSFSGPTPFSSLYELSAFYTDTIERGGKRQLREDVANLSVSGMDAQLADITRRGVADVKRLYFQAVLARYDVDIAMENRQTFEQLAQFNLARFQQGAIPEGDLIKVRLERIKFDSAVKQSQLNYRQASIRLLEEVGEANFAAADIAGTLDLKLVTPDLESTREIALRERTDVQVAQRDVETAKARIALEQSRAKTDINPYAGYKRVGKDNTLAVGVTIPLKTRDHNEAGIAAAQTDAKAAEIQLEIVRRRVLAEVQLAYEAFRTAIDQAQTFRNEMLNQADESRSIALAAYQEGATALQPVLEAERTRTDVRQQYFRTLFDYQSSLIELELAIGRELPQ